MDTDARGQVWAAVPAGAVPTRGQALALGRRLADELIGAQLIADALAGTADQGTGITEQRRH